MKILNERPPIWDEASRRFEIDESCTIFTYGDAIYNPGGIEIDACLLAHEGTHAEQQKSVGGPERWWELYFMEPSFRQEQEADAYASQYLEYCRAVGDRNKRARYLQQLMQHLAGGTYGLGITQAHAKDMILTKTIRP